MLFYGATDIGKVRSNNQDNFDIRYNQKAFLAVICDGMGGTAGGAIASEIAVRTFADGVMEDLGDIDDRVYSDSRRLFAFLERTALSAFEAANTAVYQKTRENPELDGMGTTLVAIIVAGECMLAVNVGDSGIFSICGAKIQKITKDHSLVQSLVDRGAITAEEARSHPNKNIILRAVGTEKEVECDTLRIEKPDGSYLLCSDGLSNYFDEKIFLDIIEGDATQDKKVHSLINHALESGGGDNITAILVSF